MSIRWSVFGACLLVLFAPRTARATQIYAVTFTTIYAIDPDAQTVTALTPALPASDGGTIATLDPGGIYVGALGGSLYRFRPGSGLTRIDAIEAFPNGLGEGRDGFLYGVGLEFLYRIDPEDPHGVFVGKGIAPSAGDVAADPSGNLFVSVNGPSYSLAAVSKVDGAQTPIGSDTNSWWGLAFTRDGRLWGAESSTGKLFQIDPTTGVATFAMETVPLVLDLASELACGNGIVDAGEACDDGNLASGDGCSDECAVEPCFTCSGTPSACTPLPDNLACDDGTLCTSNNHCVGGACVGDPIPAPTCHPPAEGHKAKLLIQDKQSNRNKLVWSMTKGQATAIGEFGAPATSTDYELCVYDAVPSVIATLRVPAGGTCVGKPCWVADSKKATYDNKNLRPDGVRSLLLRFGVTNGKPKIMLKGNGDRLDVPLLPIANLPVVVQLRNSAGGCWGATYGSPQKNDAGQFKAATD